MQHHLVFTLVPSGVFGPRYLCCESQSDLTEWYATFLSIQVSLEMLPGHVAGGAARASALVLNGFCCSPFLPKHDGDLWPKDGIQNKQMNRALPDKRIGSVSLIPLRGSENEMRKSVAAFSQDPLSVSKGNTHTLNTQVTSGPLTGGYC